MPASHAASGRLIPVQPLRPRDHAFVGYGDDEVRWEAVTACVRLGLARGEKALVPPCPGVPTDEVLARIDLPNRSPARARERGQLVIATMRELIRPDAEFTAARQLARLRAFSDMGRVADLGAGGVLCFVGEADAANRAAWLRSLEGALARGAAGHERVEVRCDRGRHRRVRRLGVAAVPRRAPIRTEGGARPC
ncbi:MEDS domain-containing protein [Streptomyces sp. NPDC057743]|uniref:MEDS domain-containing protein n=1 Tax=Streptomyces sp. NPDC057743 TaxID=3346236 RepID=UPI00368BB42D